MRKPLILILFSLPLLLCAQIPVDSLLQNIGLSRGYISVDQSHKIEFIKTQFKPNQKGLIVYCQGSLPSPLYVESRGDLWSTVPLKLADIEDDYQVVILSKPGIPLIVAKSKLNDRYLFVDENGLFPEAYLQKNYLDYYVEATNQLIEKMSESHSYKRILVMGHSQGARVATKVASTNPTVSHLIYLSGNPLGRYDQMIREKREANLLGILSDEEAQEEIEQLYKRWAAINADKESLDSNGGDSNKTWTSFSESTMDELLQLDIPIFVGYGTRDIVARYCDLLPIHFIQAGKDNLSLHAYPGYDHSFYRKGSDGRVDFDDYIFQQVVVESLQWAAKN